MSQRHKIENYNTASNGEVHAQGVVADSIAAQVDPENYNVLLRAPGKATQVPEGGYVVPEGPSGGPLQGSSMSGAIPESVQPEPNPEPELPAPVLNSIDPSSAMIGDEDLTMNANGSQFVEGAVIVFNGGDEETTFISDSQLSTIVRPSTASTPGDYPVGVRNPDGQGTEFKTFTFTDPQAEQQPTAERTFPGNPITINSIEDHDDGLRFNLAEGDVRVGDAVLVEATGNTSVNGNYTVLAVLEVLERSGLSVVVDNNLELLTPIEAKGRLTVTGEA